MMFGKKMSPAEGPVNVNRFTIYAMIPGLDTYVASKLDRKKFATIYTLIFMAAILAVTAILMYQLTTDPVLNGDELEPQQRVEMVNEKFMPKIIYVIVVSLVIHLQIFAYLVHKWAKEWNTKFSFSLNGISIP